MSRIEFTGNYEDLSTDRGYQFKFYCEKCHNGYMSSFKASKLGMGYDPSRLTTDPVYNVTLGTAYFQRMLNIWDGNATLAIASYNAGSGNVGKWVRRYGDPRGRKDVLQFIEQIPFGETKAYVQRVIENSVVYDRMNPGTPAGSVHVSNYLGKSRPG